MRKSRSKRSIAVRLAAVVAAVALAAAPLGALADAPDTDNSLRGQLERVLGQTEGEAAGPSEGAPAQEADAAQEASEQAPSETPAAASSSQASSGAPATAKEQTESDAGADAVARGGTTYTDSAGNLFVANDDANATTHVTDAQVAEKRDLVFFGGGGVVEGAAVGGDVLAAARNVTVRDSAVSGSVRIAAETIEVVESNVDGNATLAGRTVEFASGSVAGGAYIAAEHATFTGTAGSLDIAASTAAVSGTVTGDAAVYAGEVVIGKDAVVKGCLSIYAPAMPDIPDTASIGSVRFVETEGVSVNRRVDVALDGTFVDTIEDAVPDFMKGYVGVALVSVLACIICSVLITIFLRGSVEASAQIARTRFAFVLVCGMLGTFLAGPLAVLLMVMLATIPLGVGLLFLLLAVTAVCVPFTAASLGKALLRRWPRIGSAILFALIFGLLLVVPYAAIVVGAFSFVYMLGYLIQKMYLGMRGRDAEIHPELYSDARASSTVPDIPSDPLSGLPSYAHMSSTLD